jgi:hypothetical protein
MITDIIIEKAELENIEEILQIRREAFQEEANMYNCL